MAGCRGLIMATPAICKNRIAWTLLTGLALALLAVPLVDAADNLHLRPGVSFTQDLDNGFPIIGNGLEDVTLPTGKPALLFFGASGDLNTNRQAKRVVDLSKKVPADALKFIIIDVDHPANEQASKLIKSYYKDYIPFEVLVDKCGKTAWSQTGEVESNALKDQINKVLN